MGKHRAVIVCMLECDDGQRQGVKVIGDRAIPDWSDPGWVFIAVEWWGGPNDGECGVARIGAADAQLLLQLGPGEGFNPP